MSIATSSELVGNLLGHVPILTVWLCQKNPRNAADFLASLGARRKVTRETNAALTKLLEYSNLSEVTTTLLKETFLHFPDEVWYHVLYILITNSAAPLITRSCLDGLIEIKHHLFSLLKKRSTKVSASNSLHDEALFEDLRTSLERLPVVSYFALADLCRLVRDTSTNVEAVAHMLGPKILMPEDYESVNFESGLRLKGGGTSKTKLRVDSRLTSLSTHTSDNEVRKTIVSEEAITDAGDIFLFLVYWSQVLFFSASTAEMPSFSLSVRDLGSTVPAFGCRHHFVKAIDAKDLQIDTYKEQLRVFYMRLNKGYFIPIIDRLFDTFNFPQIAESILYEYELLPQGWTEELSRYMEEYQVDIPWFSSQLPELLAPVLTGTEPHVRKEFQPSKDRLTRERVVDEIVDSEVKYLDMLLDFVAFYVTEIKQIAAGQRGTDKMRRLGLSELEVQKVFGKRLTDVIDCVHKMVVEFEVLRLVRGPVTVRNENATDRTRAGICAEIMLENSSKFKRVYNEYNATMKGCKKILDDALLSLEKDKKSRGSKELNFDEIWKIKSRKSKLLMNNVLDSILILPVKRFPNYIVFFTRLLKQLQKDFPDSSHPDIAKVEAVIGLCSSITSGIDDAIKQLQKAQDILGFSA